MRIHAHILVVTLLAALGARTTAEPTEPADFQDRSLLVAADGALADVEELCVVVTTYESREIEPLVDLIELRAQVTAKLDKAGIKHVECKTGLTPRLVTAIEAIAVPDSNRYVYRVQTSVNRVVTFSGNGDKWVQAEVWRLRPVMKAVLREGLSEAIVATAVIQTEAFIGAYQAARRLQPHVGESGQDTPASHGVARQDLEHAAKAAVQAYPFVASRSSKVFHRADCRWAQNIAEHNRVRYRTREEALQDGKRPCKSCKP